MVSGKNAADLGVYILDQLAGCKGWLVHNRLFCCALLLHVFIIKNSSPSPSLHQGFVQVSGVFMRHEQELSCSTTGCDG